MMKEKIVFLLNSPYPNYTGGRETWLNNVANRLADKYEITVITEKHALVPNEADRWTIDPRITLLRVNGLVSFQRIQWLYRSYIVYFDCYLKAWMMRRKLIEQITPGQRTYVIAMDTVFLPLAFRGIKEKNPNTYTVISSRGPHAEIDSTYWPIAKKQIFNIEKNNLLLVDAVWSNGFDTQKLLQKKGVDSTIIANGVDCEKIITESVPAHSMISKARGIKIVTIGTLLDLKGYPTMIESLSRLAKEHPSFTADIFAFGKGNPDRYMAMAEKCGIANRIHFMGEDKNAPLYAKQADILLALGTSEGSGMSMAALEMLATGVPVIATDIPCYQQLIDNNENGILVTENDASALADAIIKLTNATAEKRKSMGCLAQNRVSRNDWTMVVSSLEKELRKLYDY